MTDAPQCSVNDRKRKTSNAEEEATKAAKTLNITTAMFRSGDPFFQALFDVHRANERAIAASEQKISVIDERYFAHARSKEAPVLDMATSVVKSSSVKLGSLIDDIERKAKNASICLLPAEVIIRIFTLLDTDSLFNCQATCHTWRKVLEDPQLWKEAEVAVHGAFWQIDTKWHRVKQRIPAPTSLNLDIWLSVHEKGEDEYLLWERFKLASIVEKFPVDSLINLKYRGVIQGADEHIWEALIKCTKLKVLHWFSRGRPKFNPQTYSYNYGISERTALASCRLEEFSFDVIMDRLQIKIDWAFVHMLSRVKRLQFVNGLDRSAVVAIIAAANSTIESLTVSALGYLPREWDQLETHLKQPLEMEKLQIISLQDRNLGILSIKAPHVTRAEFGHGSLVDLTLIESCRNGLKSLHVQMKGIKTKGRLGQEIFDMPGLEGLHLDFRGDANIVVGRYEDYSIPAFWQAIQGTNEELINTILPRLKSLKIVHDPLLNQTSLLRFLERRSEVAKLELEEMVIFLANHCSSDTDRLDYLKQEMEFFNFERFDEWKDEDTQEWSLTTSLIFKRTGIDWHIINDCRHILKEVKISLSWGEEEESLEQELFDMPELEMLSLDFSRAYKDEGCRGASALWSAVTKGDTGNAEIMMRHILPKLKKLEVINDAMLGEEAVVKLIAIRKELGLTPIETLKFHLAEEHSTQVSKLADLASTMKGFSYKRFEDWTSQR